MKRLLLGVLVAVLVSGAVIGTGAVDGVFEDADDVEIADDEVVLQPADSPEGDVYAELDDSGDLRVDIDNVNDLATTRVNNVFTATYNGEEEARVHFEDVGDDVTIYDMETGDPVESEANASILTPENDARTFGVDIEADENAEAVEISDITVIARAVNPQFEIVDIEVPPEQAAAGDRVPVAVTVENDGSAFQRPVRLTVSDRGTVATQTVSLVENETRTVEFEYRTRETDATLDEIGFGADVVDDEVAPDADGAPALAVTPPAVEVGVALTDVSDESPTAGSTVTVSAELENTGADGTDQIDLLANGEVVDTRTVDLNAGTEDAVNLTYVPTVGDAASDDPIELRLRSATDESDIKTVDVAEAVEFNIDDVAVTPTNPVAGTDDLTVAVSVENDGGEDGTARTWITLDGERVGFLTEDVAARTTETATFTVDLDERDASEREIQAFTADDASDAQTVTVLAPADLSLADTDPISAPAEVSEDDPIDVDVDVKNDGGVEGTTNVTLAADGETVADEAVTVAGDVTETVTLTADEAFDPGDVTLTAAVEGADGQASATTTVLAPADLDVTVDSATDPVLTDETLTVTGEVSNDGDKEGTTEVAFEVDGAEQATEEVTVSGGDTEPVTFEYDLAEAEASPGSLDLTLAGDETTATRTVQVREAPDDPFFRVEDPSFAPSDELVRFDDETLTVDATVTNVGDESDEQTVALQVGGETVNETDPISLEGDGSKDVSFDVDATEIATGDRAFAVVTDDDDQETTIPVRDPEPAAFEIADLDVSDGDALADGDTVTVTVQNTGELAGTVNASAVYGTDAGEPFNGEVTATETIDGGATEAVSLSVDLSDDISRAGGFDGTLTVALDEDVTRETPVTLEFGPLPAAVDAAGENAIVLVGSDAAVGETVTVDTRNLTITGVGNPTLTPSVTDTAVDVTANETTIEGITFSSEDADGATAVEVGDDATGTELLEMAFVGTSDTAWDRAVDDAGTDTTLRYTTIRGVEYGVYATGEDLSVIDSEIRESENATELVDGASNATIRNTNLIANTRGVFATAGSHVLAESNLERNDAAIQTIGTEAEVFINAPENWWGSAAGPVVFEEVAGIDKAEADILSNVEFPDRQTVPYRTAEFALPDDALADAEGPVDETLTVDVVVTNDGGVAGSSNRQDVELAVDGSVVDSASVELAEGASSTVTLAYEPTETRDISAEVLTNDDSVAGTLKITDPPAPPSSGGGGDEDDDRDESDDSDDSDETPDDSDTDGPETDPTEPLDLEPVTTETVSPSLNESAEQRVATFDTVDNVERIDFETTTAVGTVTAADIDPEVVEVNPPGATTTVQEIAVPNQSTNVSATLALRVPTERLNALDAAPADLTAFRLNGSNWESLETTVVGEEDNAVVLEAETPGFSVFAVSATGAPEAIATATPADVNAGETVTLDGTNSTAAYGDVVAYNWTVNGETLSGASITTTFDEPGEYTAELTVTTGAGETDTTTETVTVETTSDGAAGGDGTAGDDTAGDGDDTAGSDGTAGDDTAGDDEPTEEPAGIDVPLIVVLVALALLAAGTVLWLRRSE
ncbi:PGF-pre-PGF domain-containing protein [Halorubrum ezzemoulense]|uniref:PGF-pre-PGF domain-containing protein n=1 Tax=Halorubrum ezzemoulense TaxID=337243 RepID=UPI00232CFF27|nr:PGF-pre-PGF domain-containing protein [Halorubrum ezzemoulense]MDB9234432.1 PGF-pre-PGF domain-containing protein [Halorubrum ezzemoulense]